MSARRRRIVLALLVGLHAAAAMLLAPVDSLEPESLLGFLNFAVLGACLAPPALLAFCAVLGPWPVAIRAPLTTWLACVLGLLLAYGAWLVDYDPSEVTVLCFAPFAVFLVSLAPLALLRGVRCWRLEALCGGEEQPLETARASHGSSGQFTVRALLAATLAAASVFAGLRWLVLALGLSVEDLNDALQMCVVDDAAASLVMSAAALPALSLAWLALVLGKRLVLRLSLAVATAGGIAAVLARFWQRDYDAGFLLALGSVEMGVILAALASAFVMRACGYRLVRRPRGSGQAPQTVAFEVVRPRRQFAWTMGVLTAAAIALACCVPSRLGVWKQVAETRRWVELGLEVHCDDQGRIIHIQGDAGRLTDDELRRFAELPELTSLNFEGLRDSQLATLAAPATLDTLCINDSSFTDAGLEHLARFPQLKDLDLERTRITDAGLVRIASLKQLTAITLSLTDVTDAGLTALTQCKQLRWIDLSLTSITPAGAKRLSKALPNATIMIGACDAAIHSAAIGYRETTRVERLHASGVTMNFAVRSDSGTTRVERLPACGKFQSFGPPPPPNPAIGLSVTDAGLKLLNPDIQLKVLELRYAAVTDAGLPALYALKTLERVDLRDTAVTESGRRQLARALPECEILR